MDKTKFKSWRQNSAKYVSIQWNCKSRPWSTSRSSSWPSSWPSSRTSSRIIQLKTSICRNILAKLKLQSTSYRYNREYHCNYRDYWKCMDLIKISCVLLFWRIQNFTIFKKQEINNKLHESEIKGSAFYLFNPTLNRLILLQTLVGHEREAAKRLRGVAMKGSEAMIFHWTSALLPLPEKDASTRLSWFRKQNMMM